MRTYFYTVSQFSRLPYLDSSCKNAKIHPKCLSSKAGNFVCV